MESNTNDYQLKQNDKEYLFSTTIVGSSIRLSCKNPAGKLYSQDFSVSDLKSIDQMFNEIKSESDAIDYIDNALKVHKVGVREEEGRIKIVFYVSSGGILNQVEIPLGLTDSGSSEANLASENKGLANEAQNSNIQLENAPHIGPVSEDANINIQAVQEGRTITNPPKYLPTRVLPVKYVNSSGQVNDSSSFVNTDINSNSNVNYLQATTATTSYENNLSSQTAPVDYNVNNTQYLQSAPDVTNQIFQNVSPTNDPNTFVSPPIKGKVFSSTTHTVAEAQTIFRQPAEMSAGQNDIQSILRGSLLNEYEAGHIKIVGDPRVVKTEPMREISGMGQEPITTARISTTTTLTSNLPNINTTTTNPTDYNQYFNQQTTDFNTANYMQSQPITNLGTTTTTDLNTFGATTTTDFNTFGTTGTTDFNGFGTTGTTDMNTYGATTTTDMNAFGTTTTTDMNTYGTTGTTDMNTYGTTTTTDMNTYGTTTTTDMNTYGTTTTTDMNTYGATTTTDMNAFGTTTTTDMNTYGTTGITDMNTYGTTTTTDMNTYGTTGTTDMNTFGATTTTDLNTFGATTTTTDLNTFGTATTTDINSFGTTTTATNFGTLGNYGETTTTNVLPSYGGEVSNLQGLNLGTQAGYNETNLTQTNYVPNNLEEDTRLSLKSQDERINKLEGDTNLLKDGQQQLQSQLNNLSGAVNNYKYSQSEVNTLRAENEAYKQQLSELNALRTKAQEANSLKAQLDQLTPLKQQVQELATVKNQLIELKALRAKVAELSSVKAQLSELNNLRQQVGQMNILKQQLDELDALRSKASNNEALRRKIKELENLKLEYEEEITMLKKAQRNTNTNLETRTHVNMSSAKKSSGMDSKQIMFEDKPEQICVKGDIIHNTDELEMITRRINKLNKKLTLNLLYKASADSDKASAFHNKCDDAQSSLVLVETDKGKRFGGYTTCSWKGDCVDKKDENAFVFSLDKMKTYDNIPGEDAVGCYPKFGPIFLGCQIRVYDNAFSKGGTTYEKGLNYNTEEDYELTGGDRAFNIKEIEVYEVIPQ